MTDEFQSGGDSLPGVKFTNIGDKVTGQIIDARKRPDLDMDGKQRYWDEAKTQPREVWVFDLDTTGTGEADSSLWVRGNMYTVIRDALKDAGILTVGATIRVEHHALGDPPKKGYAAPKLFTAKAKAGPPLRPPVDAFSGGGGSVADEEEPF